jgi:hypothetical protein
MPFQFTTPANLWQPPSGWSPVTPIAAQSITLLEHEWVLHVYRYCDDLFAGLLRAAGTPNHPTAAAVFHQH